MTRKVLLSKEEIDNCKKKAAKDMALNSIGDFQVFSADSRLKQREVGVLCEYAFLKYYNLICPEFFDKELDNGIDWESYDKKTFDIKGTQHKNGVLLQSSYQFQNCKANFLILVCQESDFVYCIVGYIGKNAFKKYSAPIEIYCDKLSHRVTRVDLLPMWLFEETYLRDS